MSKKIIKILGTGCPKCKTTTSLVEEVVKENNIDAEIIKVDDIMEIMNYNIMSTPGLVIDEKLTVKGRVPTKTEILELLNSSDPKSDNNNGQDCCSDTSCC